MTGYRLMVRRDGARVRCFTRNGNDWADRFPAIVDAANGIKATSFLIDGEVVVISIDGMTEFYALRSRRDLPLIERKQRLARLIGRAMRRAIRFNEQGDIRSLVRCEC